MSLNPIIEILGRRLRLGIIGGGEGSFIGPMHKLAARFDDRYELVAGVFSSKPDRSEKASIDMGFEKGRIYKTVIEMFEKETSRLDKIDVVSIMTPNNSHYEYAMVALDKGFDVICDKPMTNTLEQAEKLYAKVQETEFVFCLTRNYTGYPMVRQAKAMVENGDIGVVRLVQVEYVQGGRAAEIVVDVSKPRMWKYNPEISGPSLVMGDIGTHAHNLLRFITGLEVSEVSAKIGNVVPNRQIDDYAGALIRMSNGARGCFWVTQAASGVENCLRIRVRGSKGSLEWMQEIQEYNL